MRPADCIDHAIRRLCRMRGAAVLHPVGGPCQNLNACATVWMERWNLFRCRRSVHCLQITAGWPRLCLRVSVWSVMVVTRAAAGAPRRNRASELITSSAAYSAKSAHHMKEPTGLLVCSCCIPVHSLSCIIYICIIDKYCVPRSRPPCCNCTVFMVARQTQHRQQRPAAGRSAAGSSRGPRAPVCLDLSCRGWGLYHIVQL